MSTVSCDYVLYHIPFRPFTASSIDAKLDLYVRRGNTTPQPTLIFMHGGGWTGGTKAQRALAIQPYLAMGLNVVNVEYRLAKVAPAPAAVEDCRCALKWVYSHAKEFGIDTQRLVVAGDSAGGHLAMMTGFLPASAGMERQCARNEYLGSEPVVAAGAFDPRRRRSNCALQ